jgi:uncharacterized protein YbbK (DUF523 family)
MRLRVGISACLLGEAVRYDGAHKRDATLLEALGPHVEWVPVCPEVELGLGVPREPIALEVGAQGETRLVARETRRDLTDAMAQYAKGRVVALEVLGIAGYILKARSPSCAPAGVAVAGGAEPGMFARVLRARLPRLPVASEEDLASAAARDAFLAAVRAYAGSVGS